MDRFQRRAVIEVGRSPSASGPIVFGLLAIAFGLAIPGGKLIALFGAISLFGGIGNGVRKLIKGFSGLTNKAYKQFFETQQEKQLRSLRELDRRLQRDGDERTHNLLRQLWHMYQTLQKDIESGKLNYGARDVLEKVDSMFNVCVEHLDLSYRLWEQARRQGGFESRQRWKHREELIEEVRQSVAHLETVVTQLEESAVERNTGELKRLREELEESLRIAKAVEERTAELDEPDKVYEPI